MSMGQHSCLSLLMGCRQSQENVDRLVVWGQSFGCGPQKVRLEYEVISLSYIVILGGHSCWSLYSV